jgi:hypothetical protein
MNAAIAYQWAHSGPIPLRNLKSGRYPFQIQPPEHFQEKWNPVFRPKMRQRKNARAVSASGQRETAPKVKLGR